MDNLIEAIKQLKKEKNAIILGHYYQKGENTRYSRLRGRQSGFGAMGSPDGSGHYRDVRRSLHGRNGKGALSR